MSETETVCELCGRASVPLTRHHLIPLVGHRNRRIRRQYEREELNGRVLWVCRPCHSHIHAILSEKALAERHNTRMSLLAHPKVQRFVDGIRDKPAGFKPRSPGRRGRRR